MAVHAELTHLLQITVW